MAGFFEQYAGGPQAAASKAPAIGRAERIDRSRRLYAKIDAAQDSKADRRYWANADALGPNAALDTTTRYKLRNRGRYEAINNSYCRGLVRSFAYDLIGTCPRLQLSIPGIADDDPSPKTVERNYARWARVVGLGRKYRIMEKGAARCGEGLGLLTTNPRQKNPVQLDLRLLEPEMLCSPWTMLSDDYVIDGIRFDAAGNPVEYYILNYHPGEQLGFTGTAPYTVYPAQIVVHWFEQDRAGQARGIPRITSSLPLFSQLRRWTLSTLTAAEFASMLAGVMKSTLKPPEGADPADVDDWDLFELVRGALLTLPQGYEATQFKPEHPTAQYGDFKRELLNEAGRGNGAPLNVVTGNSSGYNYSSGRLDHLPYHRGLRIDREDFRLMVSDPVFEAWYVEARMVGQIPENLPPIEEWSWTWGYDGFDEIDPQKAAQADDIRLKNGTTTYKEILAEYNQDEEEHFQQLAREKRRCEQLGLPWPILSSGPQSGGAAAAEVADPEQGREDPQDAVAFALAEHGMPEDQIEAVLAELRPHLASIFPRRFNGKKINGHRLKGAPA